MEVGRSIFKAIADFSGIRREARATGDDLDKMAKRTEQSGSGAGAAFAKGFGGALGKLLLIAPLIGAIGAAGLAGAANLLTLAASLGALTGLAVPAYGALMGFATAGVALGMGIATMKKRLADLAPAFKAMSDSVGSNFMYFAEGPIRSMVKTLLPDLRDGLENIGSSWGKVTGDIANAMKTHLGSGVLSMMLEKTRQMIENLRPAIEPVVQAFVELGGVGAEYLPRLGTWIATVAAKFADFVNAAASDGKLKKWADAGIAGLKDLWSIVKSVIGIFDALVKAAQLSGATSTLSTLAGGLEKISTLMNGPGFQKAMSTVFNGAGKGADALLSALGPLGSMFEQIAPALSLFLQLGGQIVGTVLTALANALANPVLMTGLNALMGGLLIAVTAIAPALGPLATALGAVFIALAPVLATLGPVLAVAITALSGLIIAISPLLPALVPLAGVIAAVVQGIKMFESIKGIIELVRGATVVQWLWNAALAANPIGLTILAIAALVAALVWFFTQTDLGRQIWGGFVNWLSVVIGGFLNWWNGTFWPGISVVFGLIAGAVNQFMGVWNMVWGLIWTAVLGFGNMIIGFVASIPGTIIGWLFGLAVLGALAWGWFMGMVNSAMSAGGALLGWVAGLPGQVLSYLGDLGGLLLGAGQSLIQGFIDGISSMIGAVGSAVGGVMDFIGGFFPHSPAKRGEFSGSGWTPFRGKALVQGFADGITAGTKSGEQAAGYATTAISNQLNPVISPLNALGGVPQAAVAPAMAPAVQGSVNPAPAGGGGRSLAVTINNPVPEAPTRSIEKTYAKIAYLGLDAEVPAHG